MELEINGEARTVPEETQTVGDLLEELDLNPNRVAVEVEQQVISGDEYETYQLDPGNSVEIVTFVGGG